MITFAVCEDEAYFAEGLKTLLEEYVRQRDLDSDIRVFLDGESLLSAGEEYDVILMDIRLPCGDGLEVMRRLRDAGACSQLIFITAYQEYALRAFALDTVHYLLKPVTPESLFPAIDRAVKRIAREKERVFLLAKGSAVVRIRLQEILYCEALDHRITIHTCSGEPYTFTGALDAVQERLDGRFFRCHRSYLVNLDRVDRMEPGAAVVEGGSRVLIARRKQREFVRRLLESCRKGLH